MNDRQLDLMNLLTTWNELSTKNTALQVVFVKKSADDLAETIEKMQEVQANKYSKEFLDLIAFPLAGGPALPITSFECRVDKIMSALLGWFFFSATYAESLPDELIDIQTDWSIDAAAPTPPKPLSPTIDLESVVEDFLVAAEQSTPPATNPSVDERAIDIGTFEGFENRLVQSPMQLLMNTTAFSLMGGQNAPVFSSTRKRKTLIIVEDKVGNRKATIRQLLGYLDDFQCPGDRLRTRYGRRSNHDVPSQ
ncbi:hypothetical protein C8R43DRAFT_1128051 [Mycena crocata]|nr:hypothetical protein C8R43DRAFT_1128051 [Mycena crocata]